MKTKNNLVFILIFNLLTLISMFCIWYEQTITEKHQITTDGYRIGLTIRMDERFLDGQDDYEFVIREKSTPENHISFSVENCQSRCWILQECKSHSHLILLYGCMENQAILLINLKSRKTYRLKKKPDHFVLLDTLTNLYQDKQLGENFHY